MSSKPIITASAALIFGSAALAFAHKSGDRYVNLDGRMTLVVDDAQGKPMDRGAANPPMISQFQLDAMKHRREHLRDYRGTEIQPRNGIDDQTLAIENAVIERLAQDPTLPQERIEYFRWCNTDEIILTGWYGLIKDFEPCGVNSGFVVVGVSPRIETFLGAVSFTPDQFLETYYFDGETLHFLNGESSGNPKHLLTD